MPGFTAPKLVWVRENEPAVFKDTRCVLLPKDYVRLLMTGEKASDCSDAAGTLWVDVARRKWSPEMLAATGLNESHMPRLVEGTDVTGNLRKEVAADWGMDAVPVAGGGGDNAAGAAGIGVIQPGDAFLSLGTSGVLFLVTPKFLPNSAKAVHGNEMRATLRDSGGRELIVVFRVFDDGVGFRYEFPKQAALPEVNIVEELTEFAIAEPATAWWIPGGEWNRYEYLYNRTPLAELGQAHTPVTLKLASGVHVAIHEAALVDYAGMTGPQRTKCVPCSTSRSTRGRYSS